MTKITRNLLMKPFINNILILGIGATMVAGGCSSKESEPASTSQFPVIEVIEQPVETKGKKEKTEPVPMVVSAGETVTLIPQVEEKKPVDDDKVFKSVEQMPSYPGGDAALLQDVANNLQYPAMAQENGTQGRVVLQFVVTKNGSIGEVKVVRSLSPECDQAAIKAVKKLKKFNPGRQNGNAVNVWYTLPVTFKLQT